MGFDTISIIVLLISILGVIIIILKRLPEAVEMELQQSNQVESEGSFKEKGLPEVKVSKFKTWFGFWLKRFWSFLLEVKGLRPGSHVGYRVKQVLKKKRREKEIEIFIPPIEDRPESSVQDENYYLKKIKEDPKNFENFKGLGQFYIDQKSFTEAKDVYLYLIKHIPGDPLLYGKLAYVNFYIKDYKQAIEFYEKSLALDSSHPNRFYNLSLCYEGVGDFKKAIIAIKKALEIEPEVTKYKDTLVRLESRLEAKNFQF